MGVYSNTVSITQYSIRGDLPKSDQFDWFSQKLAARGFQSIEESADELSEGWCHVDSPDESGFEAPADFWRDSYLFFSLRRDQRKIPTAVLKSRSGRGEAAFLAEHPNFRRVPKQKREAIKEQVQMQLLSRCLPVPATADVVWDLNRGIVSVFSLSLKSLERFEDFFRKTFEGLHPVIIHPFARARMLLEGQFLDKLEATNQAGSDTVTALISDNKWLGADFMIWLLQRGLNGEGEFGVCCNGHFNLKENFSAWIDDRIQIQGGGEDGGVQKVSVSGSQDSYLEAISALKNGKQITNATICMEKDENIWKLTLKGETFSFASFKCPQIKIERNSNADERSEREAAFYERMFLLEQGLQLFDSLFSAFLKERLCDAWANRLAAIHKWLNAA
ncbi:MAG: recombination-associated protein RdgC [Deltaproteobacteria bacterium]